MTLSENTIRDIDFIEAALRRIEQASVEMGRASVADAGQAAVAGVNLWIDSIFDAVLCREGSTLA